MKDEREDEFLEVKDETIDLSWVNQLKAEMHDGLFEELKKNRQACGLLIPLVPHNDLIELLAELHELRQEKILKNIENEAKIKHE